MIYIFRCWTRWQLSRQENRTRRALLEADYARLNWLVETQILIRDEVAVYPSSPFHRRIVLPDSSNKYTLQIDAHTGRVFQRLASEDGFESEHPGSLVYSMNPNGQIAVLVSPHSSDHVSIMEKSFILDIIPFSRLAGITGRLQVRRHLDIFSHLCLISMTEACPTLKSEKFLEALKVKTEKYRNVFQDSGEHRKNRTIQEINLGIALAAGIMASTLLPLLPEVSKWARERAEAFLNLCVATRSYNECKSNGGYELFNLVGAITTPALVWFGAALTVYLIWTVNKLLKRR